MREFSIIDFFVLKEVREALAIYEYAYKICRYPQAMEVVESQTELMGWDDPMEWILNTQSTEVWATFQITRYNSCYHRLVDYTLFCLSLCGILPAIDRLYLCKNTFLPKKGDYHSLAGIYDIAYDDYCERYITRIFNAAGWSLTYMVYEEFSANEAYRHLIIPMITEDGYIDFLYDYGINGEEDYIYFLFTSEEDYSYVVLFFIFHHFFTEAAIGIVNSHSVVLCVPSLTIVDGMMIDSDWSQYCPLSALDALFYHMQRKFFGTPRLEMKNDRD